MACSITYVQPHGLQADQLKPGTDQWCQGCNGLWRPWSMGWTETGLYRCGECRGEKSYNDPMTAYLQSVVAERQHTKRMVIETPPTASFVAEGAEKPLQTLKFNIKEI